MHLSDDPVYPFVTPQTIFNDFGYICTKFQKMNRVFLSIGSNTGDRLSFLNRALQFLGQNNVQTVRTSPVYETAPWGFESETHFLNMVAEVMTPLNPEALLTLITHAEMMLGRIRHESATSHKTYTSRTIDIDILFFNHEIYRSADLTIPHPRIAERRFVLEPLLTLCPDMVHPKFNVTIESLHAVCPDQGWVVVWEPKGLQQPVREK